MFYSTPATGHGDIYRYDRATGKNVRLTSDPDYDGAPCYSPDGRRIFFVREKENVGHVWVMDADGGHQRQLTDGPTYDGVCSFSKEGRTILLTRLDTESSVGHIWVMDADGGHQRQLTKGPWLDGSAIFSPDGSRVLFAREFPKGPIPERLGPVLENESLRMPEIHSVNVEGNGLRRLTHNLHTDTPICLTPDGKKLFYWRNDDYGKKSPFEGIAIMDADGSSSHNLGEGSTPAFSPDLSRVAFITGIYGREVGLMSTDGTGRRTVHSCKYYHSDPTFTPDGSRLIFVEWPEDHGAGRVMIQNIETTKIESVPSIR